MKLQLKAPEGFYQVGWQRVQAFKDGVNVSMNVGTRFRDCIAENADGVGESGDCYISNECFFVLGGESFKLEDLAEALSDVLECEVEAVNED